jgi:hypothetical protein
VPRTTRIELVKKGSKQIASSCPECLFFPCSANCPGPLFSNTVSATPHSIVSVLNNRIFLTQPPGWVLALVAIDFAVPMMLSVYLLNNLLYHFIFDEGNLNGLLSEKISHVTREHELLEALMPPTIADRLRAGEEQIADGYGYCLNPQPPTLNHQPPTPDPQPSTLDPRP